MNILKQQGPNMDPLRYFRGNGQSFTVCIANSYMLTIRLQLSINNLYAGRLARSRLCVKHSKMVRQWMSPRPPVPSVFQLTRQLPMTSQPFPRPADPGPRCQLTNSCDSSNPASSINPFCDSWQGTWSRPASNAQWPLLLTWFNFNPSMDM